MTSTLVLAVNPFQSLTSVEGILGHLDDPNNEIVENTLSSLLELIDFHWAEIGDKLSEIEELSEDNEFPHRSKASLLASKIFFHLQSYEDSLNHALSAADLFNIEEQSQYVRKLTEQCIDSYRKYQQTKYELEKEQKTTEEEEDENYSDDDDEDINIDIIEVQAIQQPIMPLDNRLVSIVERVLNHCYLTGDCKHAMGIAIECRRLDHVKSSIVQANNIVGMLEHCFKLCETVINSRTFRDELLHLIVCIFDDSDVVSVDDKNYHIICRCFFYLRSTKPISDILWHLVDEGGSGMGELTAYQIAFDLTQYQNDTFTRDVFNNLPFPPVSQRNPKSVVNNALPVVADDGGDGGGDGESEVVGNGSGDDGDWWTDEVFTKWKRLKSILLGATAIPLCLDFLFRNCQSDLLILKKMKDGISERNSVLNNALICANGIMHCGTTIDQFLRDNIEWMSRAAHWAKFTAVAALGMIHHHHIEKSMDILERYLPGSGGGPYQEGGSLYALGLVHCGDNSDKTCIDIREFLLNNVIQGNNEIVQHGAVLGLGLSSLGFATQGGQQPNTDSSDTTAGNTNGPSAAEILSQIKNILYQDRAVPGEACGLSLGLILCGSGNKRWFDEMLAYAHETQHEKIIRGLVMGIAIMHYNLEERATKIIEQLLADKDETIRYGGCYTIGLAYAATANNNAISKLLHLAVSDVSNDVRRAAVTNIGFVLCNEPNQVPKVLQLLSKSYNSHVRYGAAAALGIACAGTGNSMALKLLKKLAQDNVDYVRQASLIALGMLLMEHNLVETEDVKEVRDVFFMGSVLDKRESTMCVMGAIIGSGLIDASGRNVTIELYNRTNNSKRQSAIIGMAIFWQYWYWYPLVPFLCLCFKPTMIMCLNKELKMVELDVRSNSSVSKFAYVEGLKEEKEDKKKKLTKAVLSITKKQKARDMKKKKKMVSMESVPESSSTDVVVEDVEDEVGDSKMDVDEDDGAVKVEEEKKNENFEFLSNPSRVTPNQRKYVVWSDNRYRPVTTRLNGFVIVADTKPEESVKLVDLKNTDASGVFGNEPEPPKPFLYLGV